MSSTYDTVTKVWSGAKLEFEIGKRTNFGEIILANLSKTSERVMQIDADTGETITKAEVRRRTIRCVQNLRKLGCTPDDRIGIICRNHINLTPLLFATFCNGTPVAPLDVLTVKDGAPHIFQKMEPTFVFCDADIFLAVKKITDGINPNTKFFIVNGTVDGYESINSLIQPCGSLDSFACTGIADAFSHVAIYMCSSGSTGLMKLICMSHALMAYLFDVRSDHYPFRLLCFSSLYWLSGLFTVIESGFKCTRIFTTQSFTTELFFDLIEKFKVEFFVGPASQIQAFLKSDRCKSADLSSLTICFSIGGYTPSIVNETIKVLVPHCIFLTAYGITETGGGVSITKPKELDEFPNTVGHLVSGIHVKVVNIQTNEKCGIGEEGEICVKIPVPIMGYLKDETESQVAFDDEGYFITGDIGYFDECGRLFINGRRKEIFKNRSFPVWPAEIEDVIQKHQAIRHACVVNLWDDDLATDLVTAVVVKNENYSISADEIYELVADKLATYKRLEGGVYFIDELPMTPSGKVLRAKAKEIAMNLRNKI